MNIEEFSDLIIKIFSPVLLVLSIIFLFLIFRIPDINTASIKEIIALGIICIGGFSIGLYGCRAKLGWFKFLDKFFNKN